MNRRIITLTDRFDGTLHSMHKIQNLECSRTLSHALFIKLNKSEFDVQKTIIKSGLTENGYPICLAEKNITRVMGREASTEEY